MTWKKHFKRVEITSQSNRMSSVNASTSKFSNWLPEVYQGPPNRLQRYVQYEQMDMDHEINAALDTIAEFSTQIDERTGIPFTIHWKEEPTNSELSVIENKLRQWSYINEFPKRMFRIFRSTLIYGDQFFVRDPETFKLLWIDPSNVEKVIVNESKGKELEIFYIDNIDMNLQQLVASNMMKSTEGGYNAQDNIFPNAPLTGQANFSTSTSTPSLPNQGVYTQGNTSFPVDAKHIVQVSLTEGMDAAWPFGVSILEPIFKIYKQKELIEDAVLIYRIHRAPERRVFKIDVGTMPPNKAQQYIERVKYEVQQKRIPSRNGGGNSVTDASYNPLSILEDYYFAQTCLSLDTNIPLLDGRILSMQELINEYNDGKINYTYSQNRETNELEPGKIVWAGVTRKDAQVVRVTLDNGEYIDATPDHRFIMVDGSEVEAQHLKENDSLNSHGDDNIHKVLSVKPLPGTRNTGDITVETLSDSHIFLTAAGVFVHNSDGRGSSIETLPGGENMGEIDDLKYFNNKMMRALGVPSSYLPTGPDDGSAGYNDGRVGTAFIQEFRFNKTCQRHQNKIIETFDDEFKRYLKYKGHYIDTSQFELRFTEPQNFSQYRQLEMDSSLINNFNSISDVPYLSKRFLMTKYLGLSLEEISENEKLWKEENRNATSKDESEAGATSPREAGVPFNTSGDFDDDLDADEMTDEFDVDSEVETDTEVGGDDIGGGEDEI